MAVRRIVPNIAAPGLAQAAPFYSGLLGLRVVMDLGWIMTFAAGNEQQDPAGSAQLSVALQGGAGTKVPDLSIEVDDLAPVLRRVTEAGVPIEYGPVTEPWGVTRFYIRDPFGRLINVLEHCPAAAPEPPG